MNDIDLRCLLNMLKANVMESISLKLPERLLEASNRCARALGIPRASRRIRKESMRVNARFAAIERDPDA